MGKKSKYVDKEKEFLDDIKKVLDKHSDIYEEGFFNEITHEAYSMIAYHHIKAQLENGSKG